MGAGQSGGVEIGGSSMGYQVLRVYPNSPGSRAGLKAYFDFIIAIGNTRFNKENGSLREILKASVDQKLKMIVFNTRIRQTREVEIIPSTSWGGNGLLGVSIKHSSFDRADERVWHVLEVQPGSPAQQAGFIAEQDYVIGSDSILQENDDLYNLIETHEGKALKLFVYNVVNDNCREVICHPNSKWGGQGYLGCEFGHGLMHRIPYGEKGDQSYTDNPKASLLRNERPMATEATQNNSNNNSYTFQNQLMQRQMEQLQRSNQPGQQLLQQALFDHKLSPVQQSQESRQLISQQQQSQQVNYEQQQQLLQQQHQQLMEQRMLLEQQQKQFQQQQQQHQELQNFRIQEQQQQQPSQNLINQEPIQQQLPPQHQPLLPNLPPPPSSQLLSSPPPPPLPPQQPQPNQQHDLNQFSSHQQPHLMPQQPLLPPPPPLIHQQQTQGFDHHQQQQQQQQQQLQQQQQPPPPQPHQHLLHHQEFQQPQLLHQSSSPPPLPPPQSATHQHQQVQSPSQNLQGQHQLVQPDPQQRYVELAMQAPPQMPQTFAQLASAQYQAPPVSPQDQNSTHNNNNNNNNNSPFSGASEFDSTVQ